MQPAQMPIPPLKNWLLNAAQGAITGLQTNIKSSLLYINKGILIQQLISSLFEK